MEVDEKMRSAYEKLHQSKEIILVLDDYSIDRLSELLGKPLSEQEYADIKENFDGSFSDWHKFDEIVKDWILNNFEFRPKEN